jgi:hypothetical protein
VYYEILVLEDLVNFTSSGISGNWQDVEPRTVAKPITDSVSKAKLLVKII